MQVKHWQDPLEVILGLWMLVSPWALSYQAETNATWNAVILGILITGFALFALFRAMAWEEWASVALGVWLLISPWMLGFGELFAPMWNTVVVGVVVTALALWNLGTDKDIVGWRTPANMT